MIEKLFTPGDFEVLKRGGIGVALIMSGNEPSEVKGEIDGDAFIVMCEICLIFLKMKNLSMI